MFLPLGLILGLTLAASLTRGEKTVYSILNMTEAEPYDQLACPEKCGDVLKAGLQLSSGALQIVLQSVQYPVDFCQKCTVQGLGGFSFDQKCFMNPEKDVFDHYLDFTFPHFAVNCVCDFSNNPTATAMKINEGRVMDGQCGQEGFRNTQTCKPVECEGSQGVEGQSSVNFTTNLAGLRLSAIIRVDTRDKPVPNKHGAFPLRVSLTINSDAPIRYVGPPQFDAAGKCLTKNMEGLVCRLFANGPMPFFECLQPGGEANLIQSLLYTFGKC